MHTTRFGPGTLGTRPVGRARSGGSDNRDSGSGSPFGCMVRDRQASPELAHHAAHIAKPAIGSRESHVRTRVLVLGARSSGSLAQEDTCNMARHFLYLGSDLWSRARARSCLGIARSGPLHPHVPHLSACNTCPHFPSTNMEPPIVCGNYASRRWPPFYCQTHHHKPGDELRPWRLKYPRLLSDLSLWSCRHWPRSCLHPRPLPEVFPEALVSGDHRNGQPHGRES